MDVHESRYLQQLEQLGFYVDGKPVPGTLDAGLLQKTDEGQSFRLADRRFRYSSVLDESKLGVSHVYELDGSPCIYFKNLGREPGQDELARWHRAAWNHGLARMLWVCTPTHLRIFNAFASPPKTAAGIDSADVLIFRALAKNLGSLKQLHRESIDSGEFWSGDIGRRVCRDSRVDQQLIADLSRAANILVETRLDPIQAHRLLLRTIFVAYLEAKGVLPERLFDGFGAKTFEAVLSDADQTRKFFERMGEVFNGDLFPPPPRGAKLAQALTSERLKVAQCIVARTDLTTLQKSFQFWRYDFSVIPIEVISSIYERFIHTTDPDGALRAGTHFTPINLVDFVLSQVFDDNLYEQTLQSNAKVLDLACGSGVFLVEMLRRLVARRLAAGERHTRDLVRDTLYDQIFGIDIAETAIEIAAFSLCLTAFELDPAPNSRDQLRFSKELKGRNLFVGDAFDVDAPFNEQATFREKGFDVVVGNPPWTRPRGPQSASPSGEQRYVEYCRRRGIALPYRKPPEQAFVWRCRDFARRDARLGLILDAKRFFSHRTESQGAKGRLLQSFEPKLIASLAALHDQKLFPATKQPALVLIATNRKSRSRSAFPFVAVEFSRTFRHHGILQLGPENVERLSIKLAATNPHVLKVATWGTAHDLALMDRLVAEHETLEALLAKRGLKMKQGFIPGKNEQRKKMTPSELLGLPCLTGGGMPAFEINGADLPKFTAERLERPRDASIYRGPLVLSSSGLKGNRIVAAYCRDDLVYSLSQYGISFVAGHRRFAFYLNAILNSSLATYFTFLTATKWGIDKYEILSNDLLRLPIPDPDHVGAEKVQALGDLERELRQVSRFGSNEEELVEHLDNAVFNLYGLDRYERTLVEDMVHVTIDYQRNHEDSDAVRPATVEECSEYAHHLMGVIQPFLQTRRQRRLFADVFDVDGALRAVRFNLLPESDGRPDIRVVKEGGLTRILEEVAQNLDEPISVGLYTRRHLRVYSESQFYVVKPSQRRFWTRSAGLSDGGSVLNDLLGSGDDK